MAPKPGDLLLHRYRIERPLGQGGAASAYLAHDLVWDQTVALKLLHARSPELVASLRFEFDTLRSLAHPGLCRVHDFCLLGPEASLPPFFTSEFVDGPTLDAFARGRPWHEVEGPIANALDALGLLHTAGLRHGDVKPTNVLVRSGHGTLIDLGCASSLRARPDGTVSGTSGLIAPELIDGKAADGRADLFALGKSIELVLPSLSGTVPRSIRALVGRMVQDKVEDRPTGADEVLEALGRQRATRHPVVRCLGRLGGRDALLRRVSEVLDGLVAGRAGPRVLHLAGLPGAGTSRMLRELKLQAQQRVVVVEADARRPGALASLVAFATHEPSTCTTVAGVMDTWDALASRRPTVMVLDDISSMPSVELDLVCALARTVSPQHPVLLATAGAPDLLPDGPGTLQIAVDPLTREELASWLDGVLPPRTMAELHAATGGLPGRVEDVLRGLAAGTLTEVDLAQAAPSSSDGHARRLDGVAPGVRKAAVTLSLAGQDWTTEDARALGVSEESVGELVRLGWLAPAGAGWRALPLGPTSTPGSGELEGIHLVIAGWLAEKATHATDATQRARLLARQSDHLAGAGRLADAWELLRAEEACHGLALREWGRAAESIAERANDIGTHLTAARLLRLAGLASEALRRLETLRPDQGDRASWHAWQHELGVALLAVGDRNRARACLEHAMESCQQEAVRPRVAADLARCLQELGAHREALACVDGVIDGCADPMAWASLQEVAGLALSYLGQASLARQRLQAASERLAPLGQPRDAIRMLGNLALVAYRSGDLPGAARDYEHALALAEEHGFADQVANAALNHGTLAHQLGALGPALRSYERGLRMAIALGRQSTETTLCFNLAKLYVDVGLFDRATEYADRCERRARETGSPALAAAAVSIHAEVALASGDGAAASRHLDRVRQAYERLGCEAELAQVHLHAAAIRLHEGDLENARSHLGLAHDHLRRHPEPDVAVQARDLQARLLLSSDRPDEAAEEAQRMAEEAARLGMRVEEAAAHDLLARAWTAQGFTALSQSHRMRARELWERVAAQLPETLRPSFWRHPRRAHAADPPTTPSTDRPSQDALAARVQKLERMIAINRRINSTLRTRQVLEQAMDAAIELTGAERGFLLLRADRTRRSDHEAGTLEVAVARNLDREQLDRSHLKFSRAIAEQVLRSGEPVLTDNAQADERFQSQRSVHAMGLRSVVCVPAMAPEGILGALYLDNRFARGRFGEQDVELLMALADQVAIALTNARLVQELQQRNRELEQERERVQALLASQAEQIDRLCEEVRDQRAAHRYDYSRIVGESAAMRAVFSLLDRVIETSVPVLVRGESGTGKELVARAIHESGSRKGGPWVSVNCGALPEALLESELFGHVRGAFTGADRDREGLLVRGQGGTVFLDELGEMSPSMQVKLLRVLQEREVRPVGSSRVVPIDCRFVCATNRDLAKQIAEGSFREDLYYRVAVIEVVLPSLRERVEDIPLLVSVLLERIGQRVGRKAPRLTQPALRKLMEYDWPGNVRQLENVLTKAVVLCEGDRIGPGQLGLPGTPRPTGPAQSFEQRERARMAELLESNRWNVSKVYAQMGIPKATFYRKLKRYGLDRKV